eukprot:m.9916 g.9916  ORF g.9916 m.9916 type:complete len:111 (-) comp7071_c0_seq1:147-479(-)
MTRMSLEWLVPGSTGVLSSLRFSYDGDGVEKGFVRLLTVDSRAGVSVLMDSSSANIVLKTCSSDIDNLLFVAYFFIGAFSGDEHGTSPDSSLIERSSCNIVKIQVKEENA